MVVADDEELTVDDLDEALEDDSTASPDDDEEVEESEPTEEGDENSDPPWGSTIVVNNTTYAVSLFWQPLQDTNDPHPEIQETIDNFMEGADLYCLRQGTSPQYGIGNSSEGHKAGMPSAAATIAEKFQDKSSSVAVFALDEGWWFIAIRNDLILSEEDILYLNEEDAKRAFFAMMAVPDWGRKIAPASWDIDGTEEVDLWDILTAPGNAKLTHVNRGNKKTKMAAIGAGVLVLLIGYKLISGMFSSTPQRKPIQPLTPLKPLFEEEEEVQQAPVVITRPWETLIVAEDLMNRCQAAVMQVRSMIIPGWTMGEVSCSASGLTTSWTMKWGHLGFLKRGLEEYNTRGLDYLLDATGQSAVVTLAIGDVAIHSEAPKMSIEDLRDEINDISQAIQLPIEMADDSVVQTIPDPNRNPDDPPRQITYRRLSFKIVSDLQMDDWINVFKKFPSLEITQLNYAPDNNTWTYEGHIYEPTL